MTLSGFTRYTQAPPSVLPPEWLTSTNSSPRTSNLQSSPYLANHASASACSASAAVTRCAEPSTTMSLPTFQPLAPVVPVVTATCGLASRLRCFCSSGPVQNANAPSCQTPTSGTACGRPSVRTVMIQYSCASVRRRSMSSHGGAVAEASPYLGSIFPVVMLQSTRPGPATHRPAAPICLVRHARTDGSDGATSVSMSPGLRARPLEGRFATRCLWKIRDGRSRWLDGHDRWFLCPDSSCCWWRVVDELICLPRSISSAPIEGGIP